jgi:hypothetical protein
MFIAAMRIRRTAASAPAKEALRQPSQMGD